jgi:hypothetical protein
MGNHTKHLSECWSIASAAEQMTQMHPTAHQASWVVVMFDDGSLRLRPDAGRQLGVQLRGFASELRNFDSELVRLVGDAPPWASPLDRKGIVDGYALRRTVLKEFACFSSALCTSWADGSANIKPPRLESMMRRFSMDIMSSGAYVQEIRGLTYHQAEQRTPLALRSWQSNHTWVLPLPQCPSANTMRVMVAVATYNRLKYVELMAESLMSSTGVQDGMRLESETTVGIHVVVEIFDDHSTDYGIDLLRGLFPGAKITRNQRNLGPDENSRNIFRSFIQSDSNVLVMADSDMLYHPLWLKKLRAVLPLSHGVLSLYNSVLHRSAYCDDKVCAKATVGTAGTIFCRSVVHGILDTVVEDESGAVKLGGGNGFDWGFSRYLKQHGVPIFALNQSMVRSQAGISPN